MKNVIIIAVVAVLILVGGTWWSKSIQSKRISQEIEGVEQYARTDRSHVNGDVTYDENPPAGGPHAPVWLGCNGNIYDEPVVEEQAVHSLEHGAVWITYQPSLPQDQIETLKDKMRGYTFMSPLPEQNAPIILTAWGYQLSLESADDPRVDQFLQKFRQGSQTPEPGASCNAPVGAMR